MFIIRLEAWINFTALFRWNLALFTGQKNILAFSQTVATACIAPKICQASPRHLAHDVPNFIQIGSLSAELEPNAWGPFC